MIPLYLAILVLLIWLGMAFGHAGFWRIDDEPVPGPPAAWPAVAAVIPARDEEAVLGEALGSLAAQDYAGGLRVLVVDDHSQDRTAQIAREARAEVLSAEPLPPGWAGKVWAMEQGLRHVLAQPLPPAYVLFCDADIGHGPGAVRELVCRAEATGSDLTSLMVRLECRTLPERLMIPAFVFFFRMLYPFRRVNDPADRMAGAAGGTMLVRREALERIGGLECIRGAVIDDCSLAREVKAGGHRIWLGMARESRSLRGYGGLGGILHMVARSAYTQLGHSPLALLGCVLGLALTFLAPVGLLALGGWPAALGGLAWLTMALLYVPMVRFYRVCPCWAAALPVAATLYLYATVLSAWRHHRGRGAQWKGRTNSAG